MNKIIEILDKFIRFIFKVDLKDIIIEDDERKKEVVSLIILLLQDMCTEEFKKIYKIQNLKSVSNTSYDIIITELHKIIYGYHNLEDEIQIEYLKSINRYFTFQDNFNTKYNNIMKFIYHRDCGCFSCCRLVHRFDGKCYKCGTYIPYNEPVMNLINEIIYGQPDSPLRISIVNKYYPQKGTV